VPKVTFGVLEVFDDFRVFFEILGIFRKFSRIFHQGTFSS